MVTYQRSQQYVPPTFSSSYTTPEPFKLTNQSTRANQQKSTEEKQWMDVRSRPKFKARALPPSLYKPTFPIIHRQSVTATESFSLSTPNKNAGREESSVSSFKARSAPSFDNPFTPKQLGKVTKPEGFKLKSEERHKGYQENMQVKLQNMQLEEAEARNFKSKPMPEFPEPQVLRSHKSLTLPCPFPLTTTRQRQQTQPQTSSFRARPMPDHRKAFVPVIEKKSTSPMHVHLYSEARAEQRSFFEETLKEKEREKEKKKAFDLAQISSGLSDIIKFGRF